MEREKSFGLNRDVIKYFAMFTMLLNHIGNIFLEPGTVWHEALLDIGYFTAITMCYFLVEGYGYTRSKSSYRNRLLFWAVISQIPFGLALSSGEILRFTGFNMLFTLFFCFLIIDVIHTASRRWKKVLYVILLLIPCLFCDWFILAPVFTLLFLWAGKDKKRLAVAYGISMGAFGLLSMGSFYGYTGAALFFAVAGKVSGMLLSGICIIWLYNGKRMERGRIFSKWFFYIFYPAHLLILGIIRIAMGL